MLKLLIELNWVIGFFKLINLYVFGVEKDVRNILLVILFFMRRD